MRDLTELTGAPAAAGDPVVYHVAKSRVKHLAYRAADGKVIGLWWTDRTPGQTYYVDLTAEAWAPLAQSDVRAYVDGYDHFVIYRSKDGFIHEIGSTDMTMRTVNLPTGIDSFQPVDTNIPQPGG